MKLTAISLSISTLVICTQMLSCSAFCTEEVLSDSKPISHATWNKLLNKHVTADGHTNYKGFIKDSLEFNKYIALLSANHPNDANWSEKEQIAYWINAYNAFTVQLIIRNYPLKSIKDIKRGIVFVNTVWDIKFINIEGQEYDLNRIEHGTLRKNHNEPRIHFAVNCASVSCPPLRNEAYTAQKLSLQLDEQAQKFINSGIRNKIVSPDEVHLSKIFSWFKGDFTKEGTLIEFLNRYSETKISASATISYLEYGWELNE
ncbi:MAG: hypothetical protein COA57_02230 [Flavobacteriales bacterium]|nr:MAG: hypothetical protein COA57_02230 [Flavobacteriales bacterium]